VEVDLHTLQPSNPDVTRSQTGESPAKMTPELSPDRSSWDFTGMAPVSVPVHKQNAGIREAAEVVVNDGIDSDEEFIPSIIPLRSVVPRAQCIHHPHQWWQHYMWMMDRDLADRRGYHNSGGP
jgi:hypothetical protein